MTIQRNSAIFRLKPALSVLTVAAAGILLMPPAIGAQQSIAPTEVLNPKDPPANAIWLETLDLSKIEQGFGEARAAHSVENNPIKINTVTFPHGVGTHAVSRITIDLHGAATHFDSAVGIDDEVGTKGSVTFIVRVDGKVAAQSGSMHGGENAKILGVSLVGAKKLVLEVDDGGDGISYDHADWAGAYLTLVPGSAIKPEIATVPVVPPRLMVPPAEPRPAIHGARIVGATPGRPFLFLIAATGDGPLTYGAKNLPQGLTLDANTGIISGALKNSGPSNVLLTVRGAKGNSQRMLTIVGGDHKLALTPPMGWNSWNVWAGNVDDPKMRDAADQMIKSGLAAHGFSYVNIDDTWEADRDATGRIRTNTKFPDMKALGDYVHSKGLKFGIYSSPGPTTCGGYVASYQHENQDAKSYAEWGFDYLKYDWCSYTDVAGGNDLAAQQKPYAVMRKSLDKVDRDIVYSFCQYGMGDVWKWGEEIGGNCWRTTGDIDDSWGSLHSIFESQDGHEKFISPGHWNDPDMLVVGRVGWGTPHPSKLTPNEQILHISMWCLLSSPLLIGCDMTQLDPFTLALLTNDEALDINQDTLGKPAGRVAQDGVGGEVWARPLADGTHAVGLVNVDSEERIVVVKWSDIGLKGRQPVRDLWLHTNVGDHQETYGVAVPAHGIVLLKVGRPSRR